MPDRDANTIYLDLPTPELCEPDCRDDEGWVSVKQFTDPQEAVAFVREHIDPYCDEQGRIKILANMPEMRKGDLPRFLATCKEVASMPGKDWLDGQMKLARAIMEYEGELEPSEPTATGTVTIEISGGCLTDVSGLPDGWTYELIDHDDREEVGNLVRDLSRERCVALLTEAGIQCYDHETIETLREAVEANVNDGTICWSNLT